MPLTDGTRQKMRAGASITAIAIVRPKTQYRPAPDEARRVFEGRRRATGLKVQNKRRNTTSKQRKLREGESTPLKFAPAAQGPADFDFSTTLVDNPRVVCIKPPTEEVM
jgi:hypothetical protein